ncbi:hypothetical protein EVAR_31479_1 [Eumeta japonica]|uniref:Uncharacterized protein n=1 Tax=Eumeta variegata TaxID=151549 RepID=A0A4C1WBU6_EUMVA|nr:hypothetical protein EVAR_31479_1 [Eumeta japonica]
MFDGDEKKEVFCDMPSFCSDVILHKEVAERECKNCSSMDILRWHLGAEELRMFNSSLLNKGPRAEEWGRSPSIYELKMDEQVRQMPPVCRRLSNPWAVDVRAAGDEIRNQRTGLFLWSRPRRCRRKFRNSGNGGPLSGRVPFCKTNKRYCLRRGAGLGERDRRDAFLAPVLDTQNGRAGAGAGAAGPGATVGGRSEAAYSRDKRTGEPLEGRWSPSFMEIRNSRRVTSALPRSWERIGYLMKVNQADGQEREGRIANRNSHPLDETQQRKLLLLACIL